MWFQEAAEDLKLLKKLNFRRLVLREKVHLKRPHVDNRKRKQTPRKND